MAKLFSSRDTYVSDPRQILSINAAGQRDGRLYKESLTLAGPNGGQFNMPLPSFFVADILPMVKTGMWFVGGWRASRFEYEIAEEKEDFDQ